MKKTGEKILNKKLARIMAMFLVCSMIFTSQAFVTFADSMDNAEETTKAYENVLQEEEDNKGKPSDGSDGLSDDVGESSASQQEGLDNEQPTTTTIATTKSDEGEASTEAIEKEEGSEEDSSSEFFEPYDEDEGNNSGKKDEYEEEPEEDPTEPIEPTGRVFREAPDGEDDGQVSVGIDEEDPSSSEAFIDNPLTKPAEEEASSEEGSSEESSTEESSSEESTSSDEASSSEESTTVEATTTIAPAEKTATSSEAEEEPSTTIDEENKATDSEVEKVLSEEVATTSEIEKTLIAIATDSDIAPLYTDTFGTGLLYFNLVLMNKDTDTKVVYKIDSEATDWDTFFNGIPTACKQYTGGNLNGFYKMTGTYADEDALKNDYVATKYGYNLNLDGIKERWTIWKDSSPTSNIYFGAVYGGSYDNMFNPLGKCAYMAYLSNNNETDKWWKALSSTTTDSWEIGDIIEGYAPYGKILDGFYVMQGGYDTLDEFFADYDQTKSYEETTIYGGVYNVWNDVHSDWANRTPKFFGAIYDEALTIKYEENFPTGEWYELDEGKKWYRSNQNGIQRIELYEGRGDQRKYCFRGGRLEGSARDTDIVTAHNSTNTKKLTIVGWNTKADGTGTFYELGEIFEDDTMFTDRHLTLYAVWQDSSLVKKVEYNSNIDWSSGYNEPYIEGALTGDTTNNPIVLAGTTYTITTVNWNQLKQKSLLKWNTQADGTGIDYTLGATLTDYSTTAGFDDNGKLTLYAIWDTEQDIKFSISYEQNIPTGWTLQGTWNITNVVDSTLPITLASNTNGLKIKEDSTGNIRQLLYWYDAQQTSSQRYQLGMEITANGYEKNDLFSQGMRPSITLSALWQEVYSVTYDQNLGDYTLEGDWYSAGVSENLQYMPITVPGSMEPDKIKIAKRNNDIKLLTGWNTKADGTGTAINFSESIDNTKESLFDTHKELKLYAQWQETEDAYYFTDGHPRIVLAYLDKDATTSTKEKITVFDLNDTSITVDSIKSVINNSKPTWATVRGYKNLDTEDVDYAYDGISFNTTKFIYGSKDVYDNYRPDFRAMSQLDGYYNNAKTFQMTVFVRVGYKVPGFNLLGRKGTGNTDPVSQAWLLYGQTTQLEAYLSGEPYDDLHQGRNDSLNASFTGVFSVSSADWATYVGPAYYDAGGYADTITPTIVGSPSIISTYDTWMNNLSSDDDTVNYVFSYTTPPTPVDWMYWYLSDADAIIHYTNVATGHNEICEGQDGILIHNGLSDTTKKNTITKAVFDDEISALSAKALFSGFEALSDIESLNNFKTESVTDMSSMFANAKSLINLDLSSFDTSNVTTMKEMFSGCTKLGAIAFSSKFKTNKVNDMSYMFYNCSDSAFTTLDISYFYSTSLNNVDYMFAGCSNLVTVYASGNFTGEWADNRNNTFDGCTKIKGGNGTEYDPLYGTSGGYAMLDGGLSTKGYFTGVPFLYFSVDETDPQNKVVHFSSTGGDGKRAVKYGAGGYLSYTTETGHARSMHDIVEVVFDDNIEARDTIGMFIQWSKLKRITGIEKLNTSKTTNMKAMFSQCAALEYIDLTHFDTSNVVSMQEMFWQCGSLEQLNLINFDTKNLTNTKEMFYSCSRLETIIVSDRFIMTNVEWANSTQMFYQCDSLIGGDGEHIGSSVDNTYAKIGKPRKNWSDPQQKGYFSADPTRISDMYYYLDETDPTNVIMHFTNVPTNHIQVAVLDYGIVYYDHLMRRQREGTIKTVVFDKDILGATTAQAMFKDFRKLVTINGLNHFNTSNVTDMKEMFSYCLELETLENFNSLSTQNVTDMYNMFEHCEAIKNIDFSNANSASLKNAIAVFSYCTSLTNVTFGNNFTLSNAEGITSMFFNCTSLSYIDLSMFDTSNVVSLGSMFYSCKSLKSLDLRSFDVSNIQSFDNMFGRCESLQNIDLSSFDTSSNQNKSMGGMFGYCYSLESIYVSDNFVTTKVDYSNDMFKDCTKLVGGNGTTFDSTKTDKEYARLDGGPGSATPGYFSGRPYRVSYKDTTTSPWTNVEWYADSTSLDLAAKPIVIDGSSNNYRYNGNQIQVLYAWNTNQLGTGATYNFGQTITNPSVFTDKDLTLYPVFKALSGITVDTEPEKTEYYVGEKFDPTGLVLDADLGGSHADVAWASISEAQKSISPEIITDTTTEVTITFGDKSINFPITLRPPFMYWKLDGTTLNIRKDTDTGYTASQLLTDTTTGIQYVEYDGLDDTAKSSITTVTFINDIKPPVCGKMFAGFSNLANINNLQYLDTSDATSMYKMFDSCNALTTLDLKTFDTRKVKNMESMFNGCGALAKIIVSDNFEVSQVTESDNMFKNCNNIVGNVGTTYNSSKTNKEYARIDKGSSRPGYLSAPPFMYWYVDNADPNNKQIHYTKENTTGSYNPVVFDTQAGPYQGAILYKEGTNTLNKSNIKKAIFDDNIEAREVRQFFADFTDLESIEGLEKLDISKTTSMGLMFSGLSNITDLDISPLNTSNVTSMDGMFKNIDKLMTINFGDNFDTSKVTNMEGMFQGCDALQYLDLRKFDTRETTNMDNMFNGCRSLESIYATNNFDTTKVNQSTNMFINCDSLMGGKGTSYDGTMSDKTYARIDGGPTSSTPGYFSDIPTSVNWMYWYLADNGATIHYTTVPTDHTAIQVDDNGRILYDQLTRIEGSRAKITKAVFDTDITGATTTSHMFMHFKNLTDIQDLSKFNTSNAKDMSRMFAECSSITNINGLGSLDTSSAENMAFMFFSCDNLASLDLSSFNTSKVKVMNCMFADDTGLSSVRFGDNFDTSNVEGMAEMFANCTSLTTLDLSKFNTTKVTNMEHMFAEDSALQTINVSENFVTTQVTSSDDMFANCTSITGCMDTTYDSSNIDKTYARIDGGTANPGYFSGPSATRSTLDTNNTPKLYIVAFDGTDGSKKLHSVTKTDGQTVLTNMITSLEKPDPTCSITGYYIVKSPSKDSLGHRVFLTEDDYKAGYDETTVFVDTADTYTETELINEYNTYAADTDTYDIYAACCYSPFIVSITNANVPTLSTVGTGDDEIVYYRVGDSTDLTGASITVELSDGSSTTINYADDPTSFSIVPATYSAGDTDITLKYKGKEYPLTDDLFVYQDGDTYDIDSITPPTKTVYVEGETFDPTGMSINAHKFPNVTGPTENITYADHPLSFHIPTTPLPATTSVTIKYGNFDGCDYDILITVLKRGQNAEISTDPSKTYYEEGDALSSADLANMEVTIHYPSGSTPAEDTFRYSDHPDYFDITPAVGSNLTTNDTKLTIKIAGTTVEYPIVVEPSGNATSISKITDPIKTNYFVGDNFDPTGLKINVTYPGGITKIVEYLDPETSGRFSFNPSTLTSGDTTEVEVTYKGATTALPVTVKKQVQSIAIAPDSNLANKDYSKGDKFDPTGLVVRVTYDDSTTEDISYSDTTKDMFVFTPALDHVFDNTDLGNKVQVTIGPSAAAVTINEMNNVSDDSVVMVKTNPTDGKTEVLHNINRDAFEAALDEALANGATGFHEYNANGINDASKKYDKYTPVSMTKEQALAKYDEYVAAGLTASKFIGASFPKPNPAPSPSDESGSSGGSGGGGSVAYDTKGNIQPGAERVINTENNLPQRELVVNDSLVSDLMQIQENLNSPKNNARDINGNEGFGQWLHVPNTTTWYFLSGDFTNTTQQTGAVGFLANGWYNLGWKGKDEWYRFDANGVMQLGWYQENNKIYYLETDLSSNWYGRSVTGTHTINGQRFTFDATGVLIG